MLFCGAMSDCDSGISSASHEAFPPHRKRRLTQVSGQCFTSAAGAGEALTGGSSGFGGNGAAATGSGSG